MERIKKLLTLVLSVAMLLAINASVFGAEINVNERKILNQFKEEPFKSNMDKKYINQFENYFSLDSVNLEEANANAFINYFSKAIIEYKKSGGKGALFSQSDVSFENFQYAGEAIGIYLEYDSGTSSFYGVDANGYIVIDSRKIIKDTGNEGKAQSSTGGSFGISIEMIFAAVIFLIFIGFLINAKKWVVKIRKHSEKNYDDEFDDEMEVANRKTRRARLQTFSYTNFKQVIKYFYIPILMCVVVVVAVYIAYKPYTTLLKSVKAGFVQNLTLNTYSEDKKDFNKTPLIKDKTIKGDQVKWPHFTEPYGVITCGKIKLNAPLYMGDSSYILGGKVKDKVENDYKDEFTSKLDENFKGAAGTYIGSSIPGDGKTILVGAHDTTFFKPLEKIKVGMKVDVVTTYARYKYKVRELRIYDKDELNDAYDLQADKEQLVLYTCYPFGKLNGDKSKRLFVYLDKTFGPSIDKEVKK